MQAAKDQAQDASVMTVLRAGDGGTADPTNLALKRNYVTCAFKTGLTYNDWMVEASP
jgi:hypothetical protein